MLYVSTSVPVEFSVTNEHFACGFVPATIYTNMSYAALCCFMLLCAALQFDEARMLDFQLELCCTHTSPGCRTVFLLYQNRRKNELRGENT